MYKNYIFDLYGTLVDIRTDEEDPHLWKKMSEIYHAYGAAYTVGELQREFRRLEGEAAKKAAEEIVRKKRGSAGEKRGSAGTGCPCAEHVEVNLTDVFALLYRHKGVECTSDQAKMTAVVFRALSRKRMQLYDGVEDLLKELKKRKKKLYLLSNAQADFTRPEITMLGLEKYFDGIFLSSEQGVKKPSPAFFRKLLETYRIDPAESIMIGNDELADIAGANEAGMDSLYIHTAISPQDTGKAEAVYRIVDGDFRKIRELVLK